MVPFAQTFFLSYVSVAPIFGTHLHQFNCTFFNLTYLNDLFLFDDSSLVPPLVWAEIHSTARCINNETEALHKNYNELHGTASHSSMFVFLNNIYCKA